MTRTFLVVLATALALVLHSVPAIAATISPGVFELLDHPDGQLTNTHGPYGLRLDGDDPPAGDGPTFSVQADTSPVTLTWNFDGTAVIEGRLLNNETNEFWEVSYTMTGVFDNNGGFTATAGSGTLTFDDIGPVPSTSPISLTGLQNGSGQAFNLFPDGHRLPNDNMSAVGRGWLDDDGNYNDWLVVAVQIREFQIPEPSTVVLACGLLACLGFAYRRQS